MKADHKIPVRNGDLECIIHVNRRPGAIKFIRTLSEIYEIVIFTASLAIYANPLMDDIDPERCCVYRLFRNSCSVHNGCFTKDLSRMNREMENIMIVDNSPSAYMLQPENAIPITTWQGNPNDTELLDLIPFF